MLDGDRGGFFKAVTAVIAAIIVCLTVIAVFQIGGSTALKRSEQERNSNAYAAQAERDIQDKCVALKASSMAKCIREIVEATNEHGRAEEDLVAQTEMALWALGMLIVSAVALLATIVGVVYVRSTLLETRRFGEVEARAYVNLKSVVLTPLGGGQPIIATVTIHNSGNTPARKVKAWAHAILSNESRPQLWIDYGIIAPDGEIEIERVIKKVLPVDRIQSRLTNLYIYGRVEYEDMFEAKHRTDFRRMYVMTEEGGYTFTATKDGNEVT